MQMNILMVTAHPDDEVIFGWPILQNFKHDNIEILCCSKNGFENNFKKLCDRLNIRGDVLDIEKNFYKEDGKTGGVKSIISRILSEISLRDFDLIFTHNSWGEYFHLDHIFLSQIVQRHFTKVITTDIYFHPNNFTVEWCSSKKIVKPYFLEKTDFINDKAKYNSYIRFYPKWDKRPIERCNVVSL